MKLDNIYIKGYKSIKELDLELHKLNILIGANGSGKSNFISIFDLLNQIVEKKFQLYIGKSGGAESFLHFGHKNTPEIEVKLEFGNNGYKCKWVPTKNDRLIFAEEICYFQGNGFDSPLGDVLGSGHEETKLHEQQESERYTISNYVLKGLKDWKVYHFHDTSEMAKVKKYGDINDNSALRSDASNLAAFLFNIKRNSQSNYSLIIETIRLVAPFFEDFVLRESPINPGKILLEWKHYGSDNYFNVHTFSDGTLRFICLAALLLQPTPPSTILLDEPELGLHPYAITILAELLKTASAKHQVIVSTQSVTLVNQFTPTDIVVVDRFNEQTNFSRPTESEIKEWLEDYSIGELWEKNLLGGRPS